MTSQQKLCIVLFRCLVIRLIILIIDLGASSEKEEALQLEEPNTDNPKTFNLKVAMQYR